MLIHEGIDFIVQDHMLSMSLKKYDSKFHSM
jgi:hypothetical protein